MRKIRSSAAYLTDLLPYDPKYLPARIYLNANESPYGLPAPVREDLIEMFSEQTLHRYPDPLAKSLRERIAEVNHRKEEEVLLGNGGDELLFDILLAYGGAGRKLLTAPPSFSSYELDAILTSTELIEVPRIEQPCYEAGQKTAKLAVLEASVLERVGKGDIDVVMLASPNNPSGDTLCEDFVVELLNVSDALVLIDQAYLEFADSRFDLLRHLDEHENLVILRTFSKAYALAGVRLGYLFASQSIVNELFKVRQPYSVDAVSALAGKVVMDNLEAFSQQIAESISERERVINALSAMVGVTVYSSEANFVLFQTKDAQRLWQDLYDEKGILLRDFSSAPYLGDCLRVSIGTPEENDEFLAACRKKLGVAL